MMVKPISKKLKIAVAKKVQDTKVRMKINAYFQIFT